MVLESGVCDFGDCHLGEGASWVIVACVLWFSSGVLLVKWPRAKEYTHSSLAADESDEGNHEYPAEVAEVDDSMWGGFWKSLGSEEVEMVKPYSDNPEDGGRPSPVASSSLRDMLSSFDSELDVSFEPADATKMKGSVASKPIPPLSPPPPPAESGTPQNSLEQLRQQSTIHATKAPPKPPTPPPEEENATTHGRSSVVKRAMTIEKGTRDSLKNILDAFDDDSL